MRPARSGKATLDRLAVGRSTVAVPVAPALVNAATPGPGRQRAAGSPTSLAQREPAIAPAASNLSPVSAKAVSVSPVSPSPAPVKISLAPPVMRPGPRTTVLTSDIRDVMRRPASAWDYAEGLPPELTGHSGSGQRSAEAEPVAQQPAPDMSDELRYQMAEGTAQGVRVQQAPPAPPSSSRVARSAPVRAAPVQGSSVQAAVAPVASAAPGGPTADHRSAPSPGKQIAAKPPAVAPIALLDRPFIARPARPVPLAESKTVAIISPDRRIYADHASGLVRGKAAPVPPKGKDDLAVAAPEDSKDPGLRVSAAAIPVQAEADGGQDPARTASTARLADASGTDSGSPSLRDRIPRPEF
ncbi:MAG: hypothetical protein ACKVOL_06285 [Novosphingobium sp.]